MSPPFNVQMYLNGPHEWKELQRIHSDMIRNSAVDLRLIGLISRDWNEVATPLLYRDLRLESRRHVSLLAGTLESLHGIPLPWIGFPYGSFVKSLVIGNPYRFERTSETLTEIQRIVIRCPSLHSFRSAYPYSTKNSISVQPYSVKVVKSLIEYGQNLTMLYVVETEFLREDLNRLVKRLPRLETLFIETSLRWELQGNCSRVSSLSIKTLVIASYHNHSFNCHNEDNFNVAAAWSLSNLHTLIV